MRFSFAFQKSALLGAALFYVSGVGLFAEPKSNDVQNVEITRDLEALDKNSSKLFRPYLPSNPFSDATRITRPSRIPAPQSGPSSSRREDELRDRKKNWIFATPKTGNETESVEDAFGVSGIGGDKESKGVVNKFLTNERESLPKLEKDKDLGVFNLPVNSGLGNVPQNSDSSFSRDILDRRVEQKNSSFTAEQNSLSGMWREHATMQRDREERQTRMQEFESLFHPSINALNGGNALNNFGRNSLAAPTASASRSVPDRFNPRAPASSDPFRTVPRPVANASTIERPDINTRVFGPSAATPPPTEVKRAERPPAVLPIPKRKN